MSIHELLDAMYSYQYSPLPTKDNTIRLLQILPSNDSADVIHCELIEYTLINSGSASHPYEALSYVWGSNVDPRRIILDGKDFPVTQNLYKALLRLRNHGLIRTVWTDAVCINQADVIEKADQIRMMMLIYAKAFRVIVWLGEARDASEEALGLIKARASSPAFRPDAGHAVQVLLSRPWFRRIWV
jgi:hypothetical protein